MKKQRGLYQSPIKARSPTASLAFKGQVTRHTTVQWRITFRAAKMHCAAFRASLALLAGSGNASCNRFQWLE